MGIHFYLRKLKPGLDSLGFAIDLLMIALVIINLAWLTFDWFFGFTLISGFLSQQAPAFHNWYESEIHSHFLFYDLFFVAIYLTEFFIRWAIAIARGTYHRWFFYPFVHWYDLLGCIPVGGFRWLRLLRVITLMLRLQRMGIIDMRDTRPGRFLIKYYNVVLEELSDRVVLNVLGGLQREVREGNPLVHRIEQEVLAPRKQLLIDHLADRLVYASGELHGRYRSELGSYLAQLTDEALSATRNGARLAAIPVAGPRAIALIRDTVQELGLALADQLHDDITAADNRSKLDSLLEGLIDSSVRKDQQINTLIRDTLLEILDQVKAQVAVQRWKLAEQQTPEREEENQPPG